MAVADEERAHTTREADMGATENVARIRDGYTAFNRGDVEALVDLFADDLVWHFPGTSKLAGEHVGRDASLAMLGAYGEASGGTLQANLIDVMASDDHVAGWSKDTAATDGRTLDVSSLVVFTMRDGKVVEAHHHFDDQASVDAFLT
jgi:ketosteroid isomerase-like protein